MITLQPVLETWPLDDFDRWPIAPLEPYGHLPLNGQLTDSQISTLMAFLVRYNNCEDDQPGELAAADALLAPGGVRVHDSETGVTVNPGCCCGIESWRDWLDVAEGKEIWLGHSPTPEVDHFGDAVRLLADTDGPAISLPRARLPRLLLAVQRDLADFLLLTADWADRHGCPEVVDVLDREFAITAPLWAG